MVPISCIMLGIEAYDSQTLYHVGLRPMVPRSSAFLRLRPMVHRTSSLLSLSTMGPRPIPVLGMRPMISNPSTLLGLRYMAPRCFTLLGTEKGRPFSLGLLRLILTCQWRMMVQKEQT